MNFESTDIKDIKIITFKRLIDERGAFKRIYCVNEFLNIGFKKEIMQINHTFTNIKGTFRGFHFQKPPYTETKIITCLKGKIYDIAVDLRKNSPTFFKWMAVELTEQNNKMIYIPDGFAHGFQTLEDNTELLYFHTQIYKPEYEDAINFMDTALNLSLPYKVTEISEKDKNIPFKESIFDGIDINYNNHELSFL